MKLRVIAAKLGLDGHDRGLRLIAHELRDRGVEVVYLGVGTTAAQVARAAIDEDVDAIAVSMLSGSHTFQLKTLLNGLASQHAEIPVVCGGLIPRADEDTLRALGVADVRSIGTPVTEAATAVIETASRYHATKWE